MFRGIPFWQKGFVLLTAPLPDRIHEVSPYVEITNKGTIGQQFNWLVFATN